VTERTIGGREKSVLGSYSRIIGFFFIFYFTWRHCGVEVFI
jgi:hypothetical protein